MSNDVIRMENIHQKIYIIRGKQVMLDKDLAELYKVKPRRLREQVKRNMTRFPDDFMFQLTEFELNSMVSQNATPSKQSFGGYLPYVFTEQGIASLSGVLTSERAIEVNISIMRAFVKLRKFVIQNAGIFQRINTLEIKQLETDEKLNKVFKALENHDVIPSQGIFFDGQIFDAHKFVSDIIRSAKKKIVLIDNYIDDTVLTILSKKSENVNCLLLTKTVSKQLQLDTDKFARQYGNLTIIQFDKSHDRFLIIDNETVYHFGASLKDLGKKWFAFSKMDKASISIIDNIKELKL